MKRLERNALLADRASVVRMLERLQTGDVLGRSSFEGRLHDIDSELTKLEERLETAGSVALMFGGRPVEGSRAIDAEFATKMIDTFHTLVSKTLALEEGGSLGRRGPVPEHAEVNLAITELVRGSMGFLLEERSRHVEIADTAVKTAIDGVTNLVASTAAESDEEFEKAVEELDPRLVVSLRAFFRTLDESGGTVRIVEDARDATLDAAAVHRGRQRIDMTEVEDTESESVVGELLGLLPDSKRFEMRLSGTDEVIKGVVAAAYASRYLEMIEAPHGDIVGRLWRTKMRIREVRERNKPPRKLYALIGLMEQVEPPRPRGARRKRKRRAR